MKRNIAIIAGGNSSEIVVSLKSASGLYNFMDKERYNVYIVIITQEKWKLQLSDDQEINIDKNDFSFNINDQKIHIDFAYITIHGTPGEDGLLQGYFDLIGIPYSTCGVLSSALTFNKYSCNQFLQSFGIKTSTSLLLRKGQQISNEVVESNIGFPCFIKPNAGGSSFGISKVKCLNEVQFAIQKAFSEGEEVIIEKFLPGIEVTCGIYKDNGEIVVLPVTEVISHNEFFDFDAKYKGQVEEITPARISYDLTHKIQELTKSIYNILACKGIVRMDYIISEQDIIYLLEVNTTPGMTPTSFIPQQVHAAGLNMKEVLSVIIEQEIIS